MVSSLGGARRVIRIPGWRKWNRGRKTATAKVAKLQRQVNLLRPEPKYAIVPIAQNNIPDTTGAITYLSAIVEGANGSERIGNKIHMQRINYQINIGGTGATAGLMTTSYLIRDLESNGVVPVISGTAQSIFSSFDPNTAYVNFFTKDRFKVLMSWSWSDIGVATGSFNSFRRGSIRLGTDTFYHDATAAQTGAGKHAYYFVTLAQATGDGTDVVGQVEFVFTDV